MPLGTTCNEEKEPENKKTHISKKHLVSLHNRKKHFQSIILLRGGRLGSVCAFICTHAKRVEFHKHLKLKLLLPSKKIQQYCTENQSYQLVLHFIIPFTTDNHKQLKKHI